MSQDKIKISDLYIETVIGCCPHEREQAQPLWLDLELGTDFNTVFSSGALQDTTDYAQLSTELKNLCRQSRFELLESLARAILIMLFRHPYIRDIRLSIRKPHALAGAVASIECYRTREQMA